MGDLQEFLFVGMALRFTCDRVFDHFDKDRSGKLTRDEIKEAVGRCVKYVTVHETPDMVINQVLKMMDLNESGDIDKDEFHTVVEKMITLGHAAHDAAKHPGGAAA